MEKEMENANLMSYWERRVLQYKKGKVKHSGREPEFIRNL